MQDRIPVNPGRVLISPENGAAYYATMTRADNATQEGTPLNKNSLLRDATAALFGLNTDAVPDDVLRALSRFQNGLGNEYVWGKVASVAKDVVVESETVQTLTVSGGYGETLSVYEGMEVVNGVLTPVGSTTINIGHGNGGVGYIIASGGKFYKIKTYESTGGSTSTYTVSPLSVGQVAAGELVGYVNSPDPNAYPIDDGYTYTALGQLGAKVQIATGSYTGTGTYGASNPNSLTFGFVPKLVVIYGNGYLTLFVASAATSTYAEWALVLSSNGAREKVQTRIIETTLNWYVTSGNGAQSNESGRTYAYIAIG